MTEPKQPGDKSPYTEQKVTNLDTGKTETFRMMHEGRAANVYHVAPIGVVSGRPALQQALYCWLWRYRGNDTESAWPSIPTLAKRCDASENSVRKHIRLLVKAGLIHITERHLEGGRAKSHLYHLPAPILMVDPPSNFEGGTLQDLKGAPSTVEGELYRSNYKDISVSEGDKASKKPSKFKPPHLGQITKYACTHTDILIPPPVLINFFDWYESVGWVVGKNKPMKSWEAALRRWLNKWQDDQKKKGTAKKFRKGT